MNAVPVGNETRVNALVEGNQLDPAIATNAQGDFIVAWRGETQSNNEQRIFVRRYGADGKPTDDEKIWINESLGKVAVDDTLTVSLTSRGNYAVAWTTDKPHEQTGGLYRYFYFAADNDDITDSFSPWAPPNFRRLGVQHSDLVADDTNPGFTTWMQEQPDGSGYDIFARFNHDSSGCSTTRHFKVTTIEAGSHEKPAIAMDDDGNIVVTWEYHHISGHIDIYARRFGVNGNPISRPDGNDGEFLVNSVRSKNQHNPDVAMAPNGDFIITWQSNDGDGGLSPTRDNDGYGIYAQRFRADGTPRGVEFLVNQTTQSLQTDPQIAVDSDGNFVITWISTDENGDRTEILAQHYRSTGERWGSEIQVNTIDGHHSRPVVSVDNNRDFVIAWQTETNGQTDIYVRRFDSPNRPIIGTSSDDELRGDNGVDRISGLGGNDILRGEGSNDVLDGGDGNDSLYGGDGQDLLQGGTGDDALFGEMGPDTLIGGAGNDKVIGGDGNDYFQGGNGDDVLDGGNGDDVMGGDLGNDRYHVRSVGDRVIEYLDSGLDTVISYLRSYTLTNHVENLTLADSSNVITGIGNALNNTLIGNRQDNNLQGGEGHDDLDGKLGDDTLKGNHGNDALEDYEGNNRLDGGQGNDGLVAGAGRDRLKGGRGDDFLGGGAGRDRLIGGAGDDQLVGSNLTIEPLSLGRAAHLQTQSDQGNSAQAEIDILLGGSGADDFILGFKNQQAYLDSHSSRGKASYAKINDFKIGADQIYLGQGNYVLADSPFRTRRETGIFRLERVNGSMQRDLVGVIKNIRPDALDLSDSSQFVIGGDFPLPPGGNFPNANIMALRAYSSPQ